MIHFGVAAEQTSPSRHGTVTVNIRTSRIYTLRAAVKAMWIATAHRTGERDSKTRPVTRVITSRSRPPEVEKPLRDRESHSLRKDVCVLLRMGRIVEM